MGMAAIRRGTPRKRSKTRFISTDLSASGGLIRLLRELETERQRQDYPQITQITQIPLITQRVGNRKAKTGLSTDYTD
jgi:hypothetical protein